ncbi:MAG: DUF3501 family protein [Myxococcota bacterium]|nr:DUF3501 family protein [Myxococcota bacterium]
MQWCFDYLAQIAASADPLCVNSLLSNDEYEVHRRTFLTIGRRIKRQRRVRLDQDFSLLIESPETVWLQIQEEKRWYAHPTATQVRRIIDDYRQLVAGPDELRASLFLDSQDPVRTEHYATRVTIDSIFLRCWLNGWVMDASPVDDEQSGLDAVNYIVFKKVAYSAIRTPSIQWGSAHQPMSALPRTMARSLIGSLQQNQLFGKHCTPTAEPGAGGMIR